MVFSAVLAVITLAGPRAALGGLRDRRAHRHRARLRRAVAAEPHVPDGRPRRAAERDRAQLEPLQHRADLRARARRHPDRRVRRRLVLRDQRGQLPRRARRACSRCASASCSRCSTGAGPTLWRGTREGLPLRAPQPNGLGDPDDDGDLLVGLLQLQHPAAAAREEHARRRPAHVRRHLRVLRRRRAGRRARRPPRWRTRAGA